MKYAERLFQYPLARFRKGNSSYLTMGERIAPATASDPLALLTLRMRWTMRSIPLDIYEFYEIVDSW